MNKKEQIKTYVVLTLICLISITYYFYGKESIQLKILTVSSFIIWILTMALTNKFYK